MIDLLAIDRKNALVSFAQNLKSAVIILIDKSAAAGIYRQITSPDERISLPSHAVESCHKINHYQHRRGIAGFGRSKFASPGIELLKPELSGGVGLGQRVDPLKHDMLKISKFAIVFKPARSAESCQRLRRATP